MIKGTLSIVRRLSASAALTHKVRATALVPVRVINISPECDPATVTNSADEVLATIAAGENAELPDIDVSQADGTTTQQPAGQDVSCAFPELYVKNSADALLDTITSFPMGGNIAAPDAVIKNGAGTVLTNAPAGADTVLADIALAEVDGSVSAKRVGINLTCTWPPIRLRDMAENPLANISSYPGASIYAPSATVTRDGVAYGTVLSGGSIDVESDVEVASGIKYVDTFSNIPSTSYATHDLGWQLANGHRARASEPAKPATIQCLDPAVTAAHYGYYLKFNNSWGHKYRFTGNAGMYYDPAAASWKTLAAANTTYATAVPDGVVYDHLTGRKWYDVVISSTTWALTHSSTANFATTRAGETGWLMPCMEDLLLIHFLGGTTQRLNSAMAFTTVSPVWTSETRPVTTTDAIALNLQAMPAFQGKTSSRPTILWKYFT